MRAPMLRGGSNVLEYCLGAGTGAAFEGEKIHGLEGADEAEAIPGAAGERVENAGEWCLCGAADKMGKSLSDWAGVQPGGIDGEV